MFRELVVWVIDVGSIYLGLLLLLVLLVLLYWLVKLTFKLVKLTFRRRTWQLFMYGKNGRR